MALHRGFRLKCDHDATEICGAPELAVIRLPADGVERLLQRVGVVASGRGDAIARDDEELED
jgi:hypothetical protein